MSKIELLRSALGVIMVTSAFSSLIESEAHGERVGFTFQGYVDSDVGAHTVFKVSVPSGSLVTGTFSYDTTAQGVVSFDGTKAFQQLINGGFTLNFNQGALRISASDYAVIVGNDYVSGTSPNPVDYLSIDYAGTSGAPIVVNDAVVQSVNAAISASMSWDSTTWNSPDDPKLRAELSLATLIQYPGTVASSHTAVSRFEITSISAIVPIAGDYNVDGKLSASDSLEWRNAFGGTSTNYSYADGNGDGVVNAADYVLWRKAMNPAVGAANVPEPSGVLSAVAALLILYQQKREGFRCQKITRG